MTPKDQTDALRVGAASERMARLTDGRRNGPIRWQVNPAQQDMLAA